MQVVKIDFVRDTLGAVYRGEMTAEQAEARIAANLTAEDLAEYVVDIFNRGWISRANLGLNDDGNTI